MKRILSGLMAAMFSTATLSPAAMACTGATLRAADGSVVYGRTLEWGADEEKAQDIEEHSLRN